MSFYPCHRCNSTSHSTQYCPQCRYCLEDTHASDRCPTIECRYCHGKGHAISVCPRLKPCSSCGKKGHKTNDCHSDRFNKPTIPAVDSRKISKQTSEARPQDQMKHAKQVPALGHDLQKPRQSPEEALTSSGPFITFPNIRDTILRVVQTLYDSQLPELRDIGYKSHIQENGGVDQVVHDVLACIDSEILALEGRIISPTLLKEVRLYQASKPSLWTDSMSAGYVNFILDDRDFTYLRFYIGQSNQIRIRIRSHVVRILNGADDTLHYHIIRLGNGHRTGHFLRLWVYPHISPELNRSDEQKRVLFQNILETAFCRVFQSLSPDTLTKYFGRCHDPAGYSTVGLNIVPPPLQDHAFDVFTLYKFKLDLTGSIDPEIQQWPEIRCKQYLELSKIRPKPSSPEFKYEDYANAVSTALKCDISHVLETLRIKNEQISPVDSDCLQALGIIDQDDVDKASIAYPIGSLNAKVGVVLETGVLKSEVTGAKSESLCQNYLIPPWGLKESGLTPFNSLIWTWNFCQNIEERLLKLTTASLRESGSDFSNPLIQASDLRLILLCGKYTEQKILNQSNRGCIQGPFPLRLRRYTHHIHAEFSLGHVVRLYISCESPFSLTGAKKWIAAQRFGEIMQLVGHLTENSDVHFSAYESALIYGQIIQKYKMEAIGYPKMASTNIEPNIRSWLYDKGFYDDDDVTQLENIAGSLTLGLMMLLNALPRRPRGKGKSIPSKKNDEEKRKFNSYPTDTFRAVKRLYAKVHEDRLSALVPQSISVNHTHARIEPASDSHTTNSSINSQREDDTDLGFFNADSDSASDSDSDSITLASKKHDQDDTTDGNLSSFIESRNGSVNLSEMIGEDILEEACAIEMTEDGAVSLSLTAVTRAIGKHRGFPPRFNWDLKHALLNGTAIFYGSKQGNRRILQVRGLSLLVKQPFVGILTLKAELSAPRTTHPNALASQAELTYPIHRLGFQITGRDSDGNPLVEWVIKKRLRSVSRVINIIEWLST